MTFNGLCLVDFINIIITPSKATIKRNNKVLHVCFAFFFLFFFKSQMNKKNVFFFFSLAFFLKYYMLSTANRSQYIYSTRNLFRMLEMFFFLFFFGSRISISVQRHVIFYFIICFRHF